jgi:hypothetical protein
MKGSKLLLVFIFIVTAVLGGIAVWIGLRLTKEDEVETTITQDEEEDGDEEEERESFLSEFEGLGQTLPLTGEGDICWDVEGILATNCDINIHAVASYEDAGDGENINACLTITNNGPNIFKFGEMEFYYCPTQGASCTGPSDACTSNEDTETYPSGETIAANSSKKYCRQIPKYAECGMVQWDIADWKRFENEMNIPGSCGFTNEIAAWLAHLGEVCPMTCEDLTASPATLDTGGGEVSLQATISDPYNAISAYDYGASTGSVSGDGTSATWTVPSGTSEGEYSAWVMATGGTIQGSTIQVSDAGCDGPEISDCTSGSQECRVTIEVQDDEPPSENPTFDAEKTASSTCINNDTAARVTYSITVTNTSSVAGTILSVTDTYDSDIQSTWVSSITPTPDSHSGNVITWNNDGDGWELDPDEELSFSYVVTVPAANFGTFGNVVIVRPEEGDDITRRAEIDVSCEIPPTPPSTGIFDDALTTALFGLAMILFGTIVIRVQNSQILGQVKAVYRKVNPTRKERFEKEMVRRASEE